MPYSLIPRYEAGMLSDQWKSLIKATQADDQAIVWVLRGIAKHLPGSFLVVEHGKDWKALLHYLARRKTAGILRTREWPMLEGMLMHLSRSARANKD